MKKRATLFLIIVVMSAFFPMSASSWYQEVSRRIVRQEFPSWMQKQVEKDLMPFAPQGTLAHYAHVSQFPEASIVDINSHALGGHYLIRIEIKDNKILAPEVDTAIQRSRKKYVIKALEDLASCIRLPDVMFYLDIGDGYTKYDKELPCTFPVFAFSKDQHQDAIILFPDSQNLSGRVSESEIDPNFAHIMLEEARAAFTRYPWHFKEEKLIWRGSNADMLNPDKESSRLILCKLSHNNPALIDAGFTLVYGAQEHEQKICQPFLKQSLTLEEHLRYKYQILLDGVTTSWSRAYWQLLSNCLIFKQDSPDIQWYYGALKPYVHYVPVNNDLSDLPEKMRWAQARDWRAEKITRNATRFAEQHLSYAAHLLYIYLLLKKYNELMKTS